MSQFILQPFFRFYVTSSSLNSPGEVILQPFRYSTYVKIHFPILPSLYLRTAYSQTLPFVSPTSQFILQPFFRFYVTSSSLNSPGELIFQPFRRFTDVTAHSQTLPFVSPTSQFFLQPFFRFYVISSSLNSPGELILQPFRHSTYVKTHFPTLPSLYLSHRSFSNTSVASPTSQFILQPLFRLSYVTSSSLNSLWRAAHDSKVRRDINLTN